MKKSKPKKLIGTALKSAIALGIDPEHALSPVMSGNILYVNIVQCRNKLADLINLAAFSGAEIQISRNGKKIAKIVGIGTHEQGEKK